jgi:hypothetical protein
VRYRTLSGAPATSPGRWVLTVGASDSWATGQSGGAPDSNVHCPVCLLAPALTLRAQSAHCSLFRCFCRRLLAQIAGATSDSPVNYSGAAPRIPEGGKFGVRFPGAPDTVRWHTGQSGAPDQGTLR